MPGGPAPRAENYLDDLRQIDMLLAAKDESWEKLYDAMQAFSMTRAKPCRSEEYDEELLERAKEFRDKAKDIIHGLRDELFSRRPESFLRDVRELAPHIKTLVGLVKKFAVRFAEVKAEKGIADFADLEHYALKILGRDDGNGELQPTEAAMSYRKQFKEVLVDEYQDTNMVQEAILRLVTRGVENEGNMFMVGDVKQSIYRFRLAEPHLFLQKYQRFDADGEKSGLRIDLNKNCRSRKEVLAATNFIFKQIMGEKVGEIPYDEAAELVKGAAYPEDEHYPAEFLLISRKEKDDEGLPQPDGDLLDPSLLEQAQLEAKAMAMKIKELITDRKKIYNPKTGQSRPIMYRDIVILLRSMGWAPQIMDELKSHGIPVYADLRTGYFEAVEVSVMLSLLKVIDNPYQDIPLASVLRSPIVGLNEEELAEIRISNKKGSFYEAVKTFCSVSGNKGEELYEKTANFLRLLEKWRTQSRQGSLSELIWQIYCDTRFYDFVGGLPGGKQRQANLRSLYDRARKYEETSFRGLFRFLRFIERMRERGGYGHDRALGEQEGCRAYHDDSQQQRAGVPVVFLPGLARQFNFQDLHETYLLDKDFGIAVKYVDAEKGYHGLLCATGFPAQKKMELLAEEMRVLYVALTRSKKSYLLASVRDLDSKLEKWSLTNDDWLLKDFDRASARSYLIGLVRHWSAIMTVRFCEQKKPPLQFGRDCFPSLPNGKLRSWKTESFSKTQRARKKAMTEPILWNWSPGKAGPGPVGHHELVRMRLNWEYRYQSASVHLAKQSVSELKRTGNSLTSTAVQS